MFRQLSSQVTLLQHTGPAPAPEQQEQLAALGVPVVTGTVAELAADAGGLRPGSGAVGARRPHGSLASPSGSFLDKLILKV
jgi:hypothetical protein